MVRPARIWTSASRRGTKYGFRWCGSSVSLNFSSFTWEKDGLNYPEYDIAILSLGIKLEDVFFTTGHTNKSYTKGRLICE
jgi:hypothetical protein